MDIEKQISDGFHRFSIIIGPSGQGKRTLAFQIAAMLNMPYAICDTKVDAIRHLISTCYKQSSPIVFILPDADTMSASARNSLLKVTEEPPNNVYFIMTLCDERNTLPTIRSRAQLFTMESYSYLDLTAFYDETGHSNPEEAKLIYSLARNCKDVRDLAQIDIKGLCDFADRVANNIGKVNGANALKLVDQLKLKETGTGWDLLYFLRAVQRSINNQILITDPKTDWAKLELLYTQRVITLIVINRLTSYPSLSKIGLIDQWILEMRKEEKKLK